MDDEQKKVIKKFRVCIKNKNDDDGGKKIFGGKKFLGGHKK